MAKAERGGNKYLLPVLGAAGIGVLALAALKGVFAQPPPITPPPTQGTLTITVHVQDSSSGLGIPNATVTLGSTLQSTNMLGNTVFSNIVPSTYTVSAAAPLHNPIAEVVQIQSSQTLTISLVAGQNPPAGTKYKCDRGSCYEDPNGTFNSVSECLAACHPYGCYNRQCSLNANGPYASLEECLAACAPPIPPPTGPRTMTLDKSTYKIGEVVHFTSTGWTPGDPKIAVGFIDPASNITFDTSAVPIYGVGRYRPDANGAFSGSFTLPLILLAVTANRFRTQRLGLLAMSRSETLDVYSGPQAYFDIYKISTPPIFDSIPLMTAWRIPPYWLATVTGHGFTPGGRVSVVPIGSLSARTSDYLAIDADFNGNVIGKVFLSGNAGETVQLVLEDVLSGLTSNPLSVTIGGGLTGFSNCGTPGAYGALPAIIVCTDKTTYRLGEILQYSITGLQGLSGTGYASVFIEGPASPNAYLSRYTSSPDLSTGTSRGAIALNPAFLNPGTYLLQFTGAGTAPPFGTPPYAQFTITT